MGWPNQQGAESVAGEGRKQCHVRAVVQRYRLVEAGPAQGPAVAAAAGEVGTGFIDKNKASNIFLLSAFYE